jgi:hypothetical protein
LRLLFKYFGLIFTDKEIKSMFQHNQLQVNPEAGIAVEQAQALGEMATPPALNYASVVGEMPGAFITTPDSGTPSNQSPGNCVNGSVNNSGKVEDQ